MARWLTVAVLCCGAGTGFAQEERTIGVFVALADNATQGLVPVPPAIGDGNDPDKNLYWGAGEGLKGHFDRSKHWRLVAQEDGTGNADVLRTRTYRHATEAAVLKAHAYRGASLRKCLEDFESAVRLGSYDVVAFIGHNGLMDFDLPRAPRAEPPKQAACIVLCCKSEQYFADRVEEWGGKPLLLTRQFMYPGAFLLDAALEGWLAGDGPTAIRARAGRAYAENQGISCKAATGVFADLEAETAAAR